MRKTEISFSDTHRWQRHFDACNDIASAGPLVDLFLKSNKIGCVSERTAEFITQHYGKDWMFCADPKAFQERVQLLVDRGRCNLRGELLDVRSNFDGPVLTVADRSVFPILGLLSEGAHLNGLVRKSTGTAVWVGKRSKKLLASSGKLDHIAGGVIQAGSSPLETMKKEAFEEAGIPEELMAAASYAGVIEYQKSWQVGVSRDRVHCYDLWLPQDFRPEPKDDEMATFELWPIRDVARRVYNSDEFKFNVNLVLIELFKREGVI